MSAAVDMRYLRPAAVECHVRKEARRMGCDEETVKRACQAAARAIRDGETAHRAILAGVNVAAAHALLDRRRCRGTDVPQAGIPPSALDFVLAAFVLGFVVVSLAVLVKTIFGGQQ